MEHSTPEDRTSSAPPRGRGRSRDLERPTVKEERRVAASGGFDRDCIKKTVGNRVALELARLAVGREGCDGTPLSGIPEVRNRPVGRSEERVWSSFALLPNSVQRLQAGVTMRSVRQFRKGVTNPPP